LSAELQSNPEYPTELAYRKVLDQGFVALIETMGTDASIVQAARVSYGKGTKTIRSDKALISYLIRHRHTTPLEMVEFKFLMRLPIFVARQVIRHRTASVNEYSGRYSVMPDRFWVPPLGAIADQDAVNRQGRSDKLAELLARLPAGSGIDPEQLRDPEGRRAFAAEQGAGDLLPTECYAFCVERLLDRFPEERERLEAVRTSVRTNNERCYALYRRLMEQGVAREIARGVLPLTLYTEWYWKIDLHNLLHFLKLRMAPHAQFEARAYAEAMAEYVKPVVPYVWEAFESDFLHGSFLTGAEKEVLRPAGEEDRRAMLLALHERGYRLRRLKETCRKLDIDEALVDELWPPRDKA